MPEGNDRMGRELNTSITINYIALFHQTPERTRNRGRLPFQQGKSANSNLPLFHTLTACHAQAPGRPLTGPLEAAEFQQT